MRRLHPETKVLAYPMHGQRKLLTEGYRTRDGHFIEWLGRLYETPNSVAVVSRPEPIYLPRVPKQSGVSAPNTYPLDSTSLQIPLPWNRRKWWHQSAASYPSIQDSPSSTPAVIWNPFVALAKTDSNPFLRERTTVLDLLDDWTIHYAFESIGAEVEAAYERAFAEATFVTANAEGTSQLARRFGRDDVMLIPNGSDPERFTTDSVAVGPTTIGYVGKIGRRLDLELITRAADSLPSFRFVLAGPILDSEYRAPLAARANIVLLGDTHYEDVPSLLSSFDVGWVPHRVGEGEVGGDVIKTYEYRAAGLPVLSTPIVGSTSRGLTNVHALDRTHHVSWLKALALDGTRVPRQISEFPIENTWQFKVGQVFGMLNGSQG
jgi:glycosyltransferase involved in cell wall biosynthesis